MDNSKNPEDFLLRLPKPQSRHPVSYSFLNSKLKKLSKELGLPSERISSHSLRHEGASFLVSLGVSLDFIKSRGNWKSSAVYEYLHNSDVQLLEFDSTSVSFIKGLM